MKSEILNTSGVRLEPPKTWVSPGISQSSLYGAIPDWFAGWSSWQYILTILLGVILYDQGQQKGYPIAWFHQLT